MALDIPSIYPGSYENNSGTNITLVNIDNQLISNKIYNPYMSMYNDAKLDGINLKINSGFRSPTKDIRVGINTISSQSTLRKKNLLPKWKGKEDPNNANLTPLRKYFDPITAAPYKSKHGSGLAIDLDTGRRSKGNLDEKTYVWLVKNSWKYGFVRTVYSEEWHFVYFGKNKTIGGPYSGGLDSITRISKYPNNLYFKDLGLDNLGPTWASQQKLNIPPQTVTTTPTPTITPEIIVTGPSLPTISPEELAQIEAGIQSPFTPSSPISSSQSLSYIQ